MEKTLAITGISDGILRIRESATHGKTLAERYGILTLPEEFSDCGMATTGDSIILKDGRKLPFRIVPENSDEYSALHESFKEEFKSKPKWA